MYHPSHIEPKGRKFGNNLPKMMSLIFVVISKSRTSSPILQETVSPVWNTTLVLDSVELCGYPEDIASNPPFIVIDIFDEDVLVRAAFGTYFSKIFAGRGRYWRVFYPEYTRILKRYHSL